MTTKLRALIVDDEPLAVRRLEIAADEIEGLTIVGSARDGAEALAAIERERPDLVFLDIRMPGMDGLTLAGALQHEDAPAIVFTTAFGRYALKAFDVAAVDYLMKPIAFDRLRTALDRVRRARTDGPTTASTSPACRELWVDERMGKRRIPIEHVVWLQAERDYVRVHTAERSFLVRETMTAMSERLSACRFTRIHRSILVNSDKIVRRLRTGNGGVKLVLEGDVQLPVGRKFAAMATNSRTEVS